ncbi:MAG: S9 family peptidase [Gammaproteobacteria bacterium]|nr:S9 family peptidase [Gammaproteobacteria bacterium]MDH3506043.1 S9 family peptidase [Gammaproteobacteria bacterium]
MSVRCLGALAPQHHPFGTRLGTAVLYAIALAACGSSSNDNRLRATVSATDNAMIEEQTMFLPAAENQPPIAEKRPVEIQQHGQTRVDDYGWLRDENWQDVLRDPDVLRADVRAHLEAENAYYEQATADLQSLRDALYDEMRGRIKEADSTVPSPDGPFAYAMRFREGGEYPVFVRTLRDGGEETVLYDGDIESEGEDFFNIAAVEHSPNHALIAYAVDRTGSEYFDIRIRNMESAEDLGETVHSTDGDPVWAADSGSFFYTERDDNQRPKRIKRHVLGTDPAEDILVYEEPDDSFFLSVEKSHSEAYIFIVSSKMTTSEARFLRADAPVDSEPVLIAPRTDDELYYPEHHGDYFYLRTNADDAVDFKIARTPVTAPGRENWQDWLAHRPGIYLLDFVPFAQRMARLERENALPRIVISDYADEDAYDIDFAEQAYALGIDAGYEFDTDTLRFSYESPSTPEQIYDFDMSTRERTLRKTQEVPSGHNPSLYTVERFAVTADDGAEIPVTIVRLRSTPVDGTAPLLLYGYGSYGITIPASFETNRLSLVDRGVVYAIAHIRGGAAKGRQWYLDGKLDKKTTTFTDFIRVAEELQARGYGRAGETVIYGGSAGGLLVGAAVNLRPELFGGVIGAVPFVDVLNTISDAELPLTPPEWVEWGDPIRDANAYTTIASYSPYDNIRNDIDYPPILATGGLTDYRVTYWEPAKWVARLRDEAQGGPFFLKMNMEAGHGGSAARFERLRERSHDFAFALKIFGLTERPPIHHAQR